MRQPLSSAHPRRIWCLRFLLHLLHWLPSSRVAWFLVLWKRHVTCTCFASASASISVHSPVLEKPQTRLPWFRASAAQQHPAPAHSPAPLPPLTRSPAVARSCDPASKERALQPPAPVKALAPAAAHALMTNEGWPYLDVRSPEELASGRVPGSVNVPLYLSRPSGEPGAARERGDRRFAATLARSSADAYGSLPRPRMRT